MSALWEAGENATKRKKIHKDTDKKSRKATHTSNPRKERNDQIQCHFFFKQSFLRGFWPPGYSAFHGKCNVSFCPLCALWKKRSEGRGHFLL